MRWSVVSRRRWKSVATGCALIAMSGSAWGGSRPTLLRSVALSAKKTAKESGAAMDEPIDYDRLKFWMDLLQWAFTIAVMIFVWIDRGRKDNRDEIEGLERRLIAAEEHLKRSPTHEDISRLREDYSGLNSKVDRVANTLDRIHDYLMNNK